MFKAVFAFKCEQPIPAAAKYLYSEWLTESDAEGEEFETLYHYYEVPVEGDVKKSEG